jgi:predicted type IV restriction endonuclease
MKNFIIAGALLLSGIALADKPAGKAAAKDKITGEVVDITCYASHAAKGDKHMACAQKCLQSGMPAGIVADGKLWVVTMADHTSPGTKLAAWAGKSVTAEGTKIEKDGANIFEIDTVAAAAK